MSGWHQAVLCALGIAVALLGLAPIEFQRLIVNEAVGTGALEQIIFFSALYLVVVIAQQLLKFVLRLYQSWISESAVLATRRHLLRLFKEGRRDAAGQPGEAVSIVGAEVDRLGGFVGEGVSSAVVNLATLLGVVAYMLITEPTIAAFSLAFLAPQILITPLMQRRLNDLVEERVAYLRQMGEAISQLDADECTRQINELPKIYVSRIRFFMLKFALKAVLNLLNNLAPLAVLAYGGYLVSQGQAEVGVIVAFISGFERVSGPIRELISFYRVAEQASVQHRLIGEWMYERLQPQRPNDQRRS